MMIMSRDAVEWRCYFFLFVGLLSLYGQKRRELKKVEKNCRGHQHDHEKTLHSLVGRLSSHKISHHFGCNHRC